MELSTTGPFDFPVFTGKNADLSAAIDNRYISVNPLAKIPRARKRDNSALTFETYTTKFDQMKTMIDTLSLKDINYWRFAFLGLRQSERLGIQRDQIYIPPVGEGVADGSTELPSICLTIDRQLQRTNPLSVKKETKTKAGTRTLHLPYEMGYALTGAIERREAELERPMRPDDYLYTKSDGETPVRHQQDARRWMSLLEAHGIPHMNLRKLRHYAATWLAEKGVHPQAAMVALGHSDSLMTIYYTHLRAERSAAPLTALTSELFERERHMLLGRGLIIERSQHEEVAHEYMEREGWQLIAWEPRDETHVRVVFQDSKERISDLEVNIPNGLDPMDVWGCIEREYEKQFD